MIDFQTLTTNARITYNYALHTTVLNIYLCYMIAENTQTQMRKGILDYCILSIISQGEIYASDILSELKKARLLVVEGTLYPLLTRLKNNGLLSYSWRESTSGPPRKYYEITTTGLDVLNKLDKTWNELAFAVDTAMEHRRNNSQTENPLTDQ